MFAQNGLLHGTAEWFITCLMLFLMEFSSFPTELSSRAHSPQLQLGAPQKTQNSIFFLKHNV